MTRRAPKTIAQDVELYSSAYKLALKHISEQKREYLNVCLLLHASIRRQIKEGEKDPSLIAAKALTDLQTYAVVTRNRPGNGRKKHKEKSG
jgi:hypothetical protein